VDEHAHAIERELDVLAGRLLLGELDGAGDGAAVEPAIGVDAEGLAGEVTEMGGLVDALEQWEKACRWLA